MDALADTLAGLVRTIQNLLGCIDNLNARIERLEDLVLATTSEVPA